MNKKTKIKKYLSLETEISLQGILFNIERDPGIM